MTAISTMEQLLEIEEGSFITIAQDREHPWARVSGGFQRGDFVVPPQYFEGEVTMNRVVQGVVPQVGQFWEDDHRGYDNIVVLDHRDGTVTTARFTRGSTQFRRFIKVNVSQVTGTLIPSPPEWVAPMLPILTMAAQSSDDVRTISDDLLQTRSEMNTLRQQMAQELLDFKAAMTTALHGYMEENGMEGNSPLGDLLAAQGLERPKQKVQVTYEGRVYITVRLPAAVVEETVRSVVPGITGCSNTDRPSVYTWIEIKDTFTREVEYGECACRSFSGQRRIMDWLRSNLNSGQPDSVISSADSANGRMTCTADGCQGRSVSY